MNLTPRTALRVLTTVAVASCLVSVSTTPSPAAIEGAYAIRNLATGMCIDIPGYGAGSVDGPVAQYPCNLTSQDNQRFWLDYQDDGDVLIQNVRDGYCLDLPNYGPVSAGTRVSEYYCRPGHGDNQEFVREGNLLKHRLDPRLCLDVEGYADGGPDARLGVFYCNSSYGDDHQWEFVSIF